MKRKTFDIQKKIYDTIKKNPGITMSSLERLIRTNPASLKEHCKHLEYFGLIKIKEEEKTTKLFVP